MVCSFHLQYFQCASCRKRARGAKAFLTFEADSEGGVHGGAASPLPTSSGVWESAKRFSCILKSPGSLICYVIKVKSITCGREGLHRHQLPWRARNYMSRAVINCNTGVQPPPTLHQLAHCMVIISFGRDLW